FWGSPVRPPLFVNPKATAVQNILFAPSRRICYGSKLLIPWKSFAWHCMRFSVNTRRAGSLGGMDTKRLPRCDMRNGVPWLMRPNFGPEDVQKTVDRYI